MNKYKKVIIFICVGIFICLLFFFFTAPKNIQTNYYSFLCPKNISVETSDLSKFPESSFMASKSQIGGINYFPYINKENFYTQQSTNPDFDLESFLIKQDFLNANETLDAYMMDSSTKDQTIELWETRNGIERTHYFYFLETGGCYDLWFFSNSENSNNSIINTIKNSFQLEVHV
jgi:hypothetical protein